MSELYLRSIDRRWKKEIISAKESIILLSPYLTSNTANLVLRNADPEITRVCTVFSFDNFVFGASSIKTLRQLRNLGIPLLHLEKLHAKVLLIDQTFASIGSQNLTFGGTRNKEASITIANSKQLTKLRELIDEWLEDATPITEQMISKAEELLSPLHEKIAPLIIEVDKTEEQYWFELRLEELQKNLPKVRQRLGKFVRTAGSRSVDEKTARYFIRNSAWWLKHPSGPVRARKHEYNVYGSNPDWKLDFGANTFLVGRAIQRCLNTVEDALERISNGEEVSFWDIRRLMFRNISGAVANYEGYEYEGYYSAIDGNDLVFGTQSIDMSDFVSCVVEITELQSVFTELESEV